MNNAFRRLATIGFAFFVFTGINAQTDSAKANVPDTGVFAVPNRLDGFNEFYRHPLSSHFEGSLFRSWYGLEYSSNSAVNNMAYDFYLKKSISGVDINATVDNFSAINIGGREGSAGFQYMYAPKKLYNHFFYVDYGFRRHQSVKFTDDFGTFFFKGNKEGAGTERIFDDLQYLTTRYDALQLGWLRYFTIKGRRANISVNAGLARGFEYRRYDVGKSRMFTEPNGDYIDLSLELEARQGYFQPYRPFYVYPSGWGAIADVNFNMALSEKTGIGIDVTDIGFIRWKEGSAVYNRRDTTIRFEGVFITSPDSLSNPEYAEKVGDSIIARFNIPYSAQAFNAALPTRIHLTYYMKFTDKNYINIRIKTIALASFRPQLNLESVNFIGKRLYSCTGIALGGFGPFDLYQSVGYQINKRFFARFGLFGIEGMVMPSKMAGFGGNAGISVKL